MNYKLYRFSSALESLIGYLASVGWRTFAIFLPLFWSLRSWEPVSVPLFPNFFNLDASIFDSTNKQILWLLALEFATIWYGLVRVFNDTDNRGGYFMVSVTSGIVSIHMMHSAASDLMRDVYGSQAYMSDLSMIKYSFYLGVALILLAPWYSLRKNG